MSERQRHGRPSSASGSFGSFDTKLLPLRYVDGGRDAAATVALAQELVALAPSVGDSLGVERFLSVYLEMMRRAGLHENNSEFRASIVACIAMATSEGMTGRWLVLLREHWSVLKSVPASRLPAK